MLYHGHYELYSRMRDNTASEQKTPNTQKGAQAWRGHSDCSVLGYRRDRGRNKAAVFMARDNGMGSDQLLAGGPHSQLPLVTSRRRQNAKWLWKGSYQRAIWNVQSRQGRLISIETEVAQGTLGPRIRSAHCVSFLAHCVGQMKSSLPNLRAWHLWTEISQHCGKIQPTVSRQQTLRMRRSWGCGALGN